MTPADQPVNRSEFNAAVRHLETLLGQQTTILQTLAVAAVENRTRDEKITALTETMAKLADTVATMAAEQNRVKGVILFFKWLGAALTAGFFVFIAKK